MNHFYAIVRLSSGQQSQVVPETARQRRGGPSASRATGIGAAVVALALGGGVATVMAGPGPVLGAGGSCQETGAFTVSNARTAMCELIDNDQVTVTGTGSIDGAPNGIQVGTQFGDEPVGVQIINNGTVDSTAGFNAVRNYGTITHIDNRGVLTGLTSGIANSGSIDLVTNTSSGQIIGRAESAIINYNTLTELNNAGLIDGEAAYGIENPGIIDVLNNSGTITGANGAIVNTRDLFTINNSGQILGSVVTADTTINLSGSAARISGAVTNTDGSVNLLSGASFTTENTFSAG